MGLSLKDDLLVNILKVSCCLLRWITSCPWTPALDRHGWDCDWRRLCLAAHHARSWPEGNSGAESRTYIPRTHRWRLHCADVLRDRCERCGRYGWWWRISW